MKWFHPKKFKFHKFSTFKFQITIQRKKMILKNMAAATIEEDANYSAISVKNSTHVDNATTKKIMIMNQIL